MQGDRVEFDEEKLKTSTEFVESVLREQGPFDGIIGFSQVRLAYLKVRKLGLSEESFERRIGWLAVQAWLARSQAGGGKLASFEAEISED